MLNYRENWRLQLIWKISRIPCTSTLYQTPGQSELTLLWVGCRPGMLTSYWGSKSWKVGCLTSTCLPVSGWLASSTHNHSWPPLCRVWLGRMSGRWTRCASIAMWQRNKRKISVALHEKVLMSMASSWRVQGWFSIIILSWHNCKWCLNSLSLDSYHGITASGVWTAWV